MEPNSPHSGRENVNPFIANIAMGRVLGSDSHASLACVVFNVNFSASLLDIFICSLLIV